MSLKAYLQALLNTRTTKAEAAYAASPSGRYEDFTVTPEKETDSDFYSFEVVAPSDGWFRVTGTSTADSMLTGNCYYVSLISRYSNSDATLVVSVPARKGATASFRFKSLDITGVRFSYLNGSA